MAVRLLRCAIEEVSELHANLFVEPHVVAFVAVAGRYARSPAPAQPEATASASRDMHGRRPNMAKTKRSLTVVEELLAEKSAVLSQAQALTTMGLGQSAQPLWASAAALEERVAPLLEARG